jgi:periplasmic protein TonB
MLAYAASRPPVVDRRPHPNTMLFIIGAHIAVVAAVMSAKMDLPPRVPFTKTIVDFIPLPKQPPPPQHPITPKVQAPAPTPLEHPIPLVQLPRAVQQPVERTPSTVDPTLIGEGSALVIPKLPPQTTSAVKTGPRLLTPPSELKPPYPADKLLNEEEGALTVRLTIDENGRVTAVAPVGRADPEFLEAARRHLIAHWRFTPATEGGHAIVSTTVVTLHFQLEG